MRWHEPIDDILGSKLKVRILRLLFCTGGIHSGREIARLVGFSPTHAISILNELEATGIVLMQHAGNANLYSLNEKSAIVENVLSPIFRWEQNLFEQLAHLFKDRLGDDLLTIEVFGSVARGDEKHDSDVDLIVVVKDSADNKLTEEKVIEASVEAGSIFGNQISPILVSQKELREKTRTRRGVWKDITRDSITIYQPQVEGE